jgi:hypothetical protein
VSNLFRYLLSFAVHLVWLRSGKGGPVPPMRLPFGKNKGRLLPLPVIASWQLMIVLWLARKIWGRYGDDIQQRLGQTKDALLDRVDHLVVGHSKSGAAQNSSSVIPPRPTPQYHTQVLPGTAQAPSTPSP